MSASLDLDHETDQLFQREESLWDTPGRDCKVYKTNWWVNTLLVTLYGNEMGFF